MLSNSRFRVRSRRRPPRLVQILATATTASALSLANFQVITSNTIPTVCILAYDSQISGCTTDDFTNGNQCSASCVAGLENEADLIMDNCRNVNVNSQSLLGLTINGLLLDALCPGGAATSTSSSTTSTSTQTIGHFTTVSFTTTPTSTVHLTTSKTTSSSTSTKATKTTQTTETTETTTATSSTETGTTTTDATTISQASTTSEVTSSSTQAATTSTEDSSGGGSPFDNLVTSAAPLSAMLRPVEALMVALSAALIVVW
ncbi:hypothetical protein BX600DRAFT_515860 [Xylariales sp. PMI_506]|nr:hypothetical protein BX600DRAFT_515860 [Xylariales sp. PMI_506]